MSKASRARKRSRRHRTVSTAVRPGQRNPSEDAIRAGEQIALAAFASGLKLAAAFGAVAAKTAGLAFSSLATGADKFSELVKEEALRSYDGRSVHSSSVKRKARGSGNSSRRRRASPTSRRVLASG